MKIPTLTLLLLLASASGCSQENPCDDERPVEIVEPSKGNFERLLEKTDAVLDVIDLQSSVDADANLADLERLGMLVAGKKGMNAGDVTSIEMRLPNLRFGK